MREQMREKMEKSAEECERAYQ